MKDWTEAEYNELLWKHHAVDKRFSELWREADRLAKSLDEVSAKVAKFQQEDDQALQKVHVELGQADGADNQQKLGALLVALPGREKPCGEPLRLADNTAHLLAEMISGIRARDRRFNMARVREWLTAAKDAARGNDRRGFERAMVGLQAELRRS